ncbi:MAG: DsrE family protein [Planctomycetes bacterium]|nr:DsrE family protein [Planctomycetota bacterium]
MTRYLLWESRDPQEATAVNEFYDLARDLKGAGHDVTLVLVQNGVFAARRGFSGGRVPQLAGVSVLADDFSLRQRGIVDGDLVPDVKVAGMGDFVDLLAQPDVRTLWH